MTDIVKRLRAPAYWISGSDEGHEGDNSAPLDAATEIERLRAALRMQLYSQSLFEALTIARAALEEN